MTELKTLNKISLPSDGCDCENRIREEAKKWIKAGPDDMFFRECRIEDWIKHFFNLEDEKC